MPECRIWCYYDSRLVAWSGFYLLIKFDLCKHWWRQHVDGVLQIRTIMIMNCLKHASNNCFKLLLKVSLSKPFCFHLPCDREILLHRLHSIFWQAKWLTGCSHFCVTVAVWHNGNLVCSSVIGPILFILYTVDVSGIIVTQWYQTRQQCREWTGPITNNTNNNRPITELQTRLPLCQTATITQKWLRPVNHFACQKMDVRRWLTFLMRTICRPRYTPVFLWQASRKLPLELPNASHISTGGWPWTDESWTPTTPSWSGSTLGNRSQSSQWHDSNWLRGSLTLAWYLTINCPWVGLKCLPLLHRASTTCISYALSDDLWHTTLWDHWCKRS